MSLSSSKKKRRRILEESDEEEEAGDTQQENLLKPNSSTPETKSVSTKTSAAPSSASSGASNTFRLNCRVPRSSSRRASAAVAKKKKPSATAAAKAATHPARIRQRPSGITSLATLPSSSSSESESSDSDSTRSLRQRLDNKYKRSAASTKGTPSSYAKPIEPVLLDSDSDSDSSVEFVAFATSQKPAAASTKRQQDMAQRNNNNRNKHGIDPSLAANNNDSDSDDSIIAPVASLTIITTTTKSAAKKKQPISKSKTGLGQKQPQQHTSSSNKNRGSVTRKPPAQSIPRKPPVQPKRNTTKSNTKSNSNVTSNMYTTDDLGSSSDESSNLRRVAEKCAKQRAAAADHSPANNVRASFGMDVNSDDDSVQEFVPTNTRHSTVQQAGDNDDNSATSSVATEELFRQIRKTHRQTEIDQQKSPATSPCLETAASENMEDHPNQHQHTRNESSTVASSKTTKFTTSYYKWGGSSDEDDDPPPAKAGEDDDDDSVDTVELNKRLRLSLGLPVKEVAVTEPAQEEPPVVLNEKPAVQQAAHRTQVGGDFLHSNSMEAADSKQQDQHEEEFVLPDCDSSSSSSSSSSSEGSRGGQAFSPPQNEKATIPSVIGVGISSGTTQQGGEDFQRGSQVPQGRNDSRPLNPYSRHAPVNPYGNESTSYSVQGTSTTTLNNNNNNNTHNQGRKNERNPYSKNFVASARSIPVAASVAMPKPPPRSPGEQRASGHPHHQQHQDGQGLYETQELAHPTHEELEDAFFETDPVPRENSNNYDSTFLKPAPFVGQSSHYSDKQMHHSEQRLSTPVGTGASTQSYQRERPMEELEEAFFDTNACGQALPKASQRTPVVVDLCQDDDDDDDEHVFFPKPSGLVVHQGLRVTARSPEFNRRSREFGVGSRAPNNSNSTDEIIYFSDDNGGPLGRARPRRVTDITQKSVPARTVANFQATVSSSNYDPDTAAQSRVSCVTEWCRHDPVDVFTSSLLGSCNSWLLLYSFLGCNVIWSFRECRVWQLWRTSATTAILSPSVTSRVGPTASETATYSRCIQ